MDAERPNIFSPPEPGELRPEESPEHRGRAKNGFALVTLTKDGGMNERFINQDGSGWHS